MREARVHECAACGGPNPEGVRSCGYCRTPIATLRCGNCFHMNVPEHEYCSGCGELLGLEPIEMPSHLACPECRLDLVAFEGDPGHLYDCPGCGGQLVEHDLLINLIERRRRFTDGRSVRPYNPLTREVRYLPCPGCSQLMNRRNYGGTSGIVVDYCGDHGVWFHAGVLPRLLSFVARGGLADGRRLRLGLPRPRTDTERRQTAELVARSLEPHEPESGATTPAAVGVAIGVTQSTLDLLEVLGGFILDSD